MAAIDVRIDKWKKRLLDLGKKNRLINYRETKRSNIKIISPNLVNLYTKLVINEESLEFPYPYDEDEEDFDEDNQPFVSTGDMETNRTIKEQQKTLRNLRNKAKTATEEQGVNILYLSFGFLRWKEGFESDQTIMSPILLVPVTLTLESITSPFVLRLHEDEIVVNPTLKYKLEHEFGITLTSFDSSEDDITEYLQNLNNTALKNKWEVVYESGLSLLSFLKINMYEDLDKNQETIKDHPILRALSGDKSQVKSLPEEYNQYDHDNKTRAIDTFQVVDADSSQQDAILYSKRGVSFVLQGPPGTGKSQTITNIIAESLAEGKKVLFVSEKMAALEVVHKRLSQAGLAEFCLTLHSHKANKKKVLNELGNTLSVNKIKIQDEAMYQLELLQIQRDKLNHYITELHTLIHPLNQSFYDINGKLAKLYETPDIIFSIENVRGTTSERLRRYTYLLENLSKTIGKMSEDYAQNPWRNCNVSNVSHELRHDIETYLRSLAPKIQSLAETYDFIENQFEFKRKSSVSAVKEMIDILELSSKSPCVPIQWIVAEDITPLINQAEKYKNLKKEYEDHVTQLSNNYDDGFFALPAEKFREQFTSDINQVKPYINLEHFNSDQELITLAKTTITELNDVLDKITTAYESGKSISEQLKIPHTNTISHLETMHHIMSYILLNPRPTEAWFDVNKFVAVKKIAAEAKERHNQLIEQIQTITRRHDHEILNLDYSSMLKRFRTEYSSLLKVFKKNYRADKKMIRALSNDFPKKVDDQLVISVLNELKDIGENKVWIKDNEQLLNQLLGNHYLGDLTDWGHLDEAISQFTTIINSFPGEQLPLEVNQFLITGGANHQEIRPLFDKLCFIKENNLKVSLHKIFSSSLKIETMQIPELVQMINETMDLFKSLDGHYTEITSYCKKELSFDEATDNLSKLEILQLIDRSIDAESDNLEESYQFFFNGIQTDWATILKSLSWVGEFKRMNEKYMLPTSFIENLCTDANFVVDVDKYMRALKDKSNQTKEEWNWYINLFDDKDELQQTDFSTLYSKINKCLNNIYSLEEWIDFRNCRDECKKEGLEEYIQRIEQMKIDKQLIVGTFLKRFYRLWVDSVITNFPTVNSFRSRSHEDVIREFHKLDLTQLSIARSRIKERLVSKMPDFNVATMAVDEVGILKRELGKQRKILPLRKLFRAIPNLLPTLKPCLMMSPLSVSLFLEAENYNFDLVIFDEASQVCTEDAIGAIMRGDQVIIAGDSEQLPPTSFFAASISHGDFDVDGVDEEEDDTDAFESILDESVAVLPERTLRWHYRSRHEHLIAFSNAKIYKHNLITFPSHIDKIPDHGVEYIYVENGVYDRGGKKNNVNEAKRIAELVFRNFREFPNRSLGVVTFSEAQQQAVETAIRQLRLQHQEYERFFNEEKEEAFFIKNIENVQGDERDTIIFSIGYAKDPNGVMYMNFGPLSRSGGYRRLNVAITRAKHNVKLVGSIRPTDIRLESTNAEGVKMLRSYIEFAMNGPEVLQTELTYNETVEVDSPFEESVYDFLAKNGYMVATQVGCSGYRIDLAIKHPTLDGRFVLGVECDGATYHSARTARERDRLRQTVLEDIGWKIYRIWSTDWIKDPVNEGRKLLKAVENAINEYVDDGFNIGDVQEEHKDPISQGDFLTIEVPYEPSANSDVQEDNPFDFDHYEEADVYEIEKHPVDSTYLANVIKYVVEKEYPIHFELLCKRIAGLFGNQKVTVKVRDSAELVITNYLSDSVERKGDFLWAKGSDKVSVRIPFSDGIGVRSINHISTEELAEAMFHITSKSFGVRSNDLFTATARVFGFNRVGGNISEAMKNALNHLIHAEKVKESSGKIIL